MGAKVSLSNALPKVKHGDSIILWYSMTLLPVVHCTLHKVDGIYSKSIKMYAVQTFHPWKYCIRLVFPKHKHDSFREHITHTKLHPIIRTEWVLQSNPVTGCFYEPDGPSEKQSRTLSIKDMLTATVLLGCYVHLTTLDVIQYTQEMIVWLINS